MYPRDLKGVFQAPPPQNNAVCFWGGGLLRKARSCREVVLAAVSNLALGGLVESETVSGRLVKRSAGNPVVELFFLLLGRLAFFWTQEVRFFSGETDLGRGCFPLERRVVAHKSGRGCFL